MRFDSRAVPIDSIEIENTLYKISTPKPIDDLVDSIHHFGLFAPPIIQQINNKYIVVTGFQRILACRQLEWIHIETRVIGPESNELDCLKVSIADNLYSRQLNIIEQSTALSKLGAFYEDDGELSRVAESIGFQVNATYIKKLRKLCTLIPELQQSILSGAIPMTVALEIGTLDNNSAFRLIQLFEDLSPTLNQQKEILIMIREISKIGNISIDKLLNNQNILEILNHPDFTRSQKLAHLRACLKRMRFPIIGCYNDSFIKLIRHLKLPKEIKIIPPENFEGGNYSVMLNFNSLLKFESLIQYMKDLAVDPDFKTIIDKDFADH